MSVRARAVAIGTLVLGKGLGHLAAGNQCIKQQGFRSRCLSQARDCATGTTGRHASARLCCFLPLCCCCACRRLLLLLSVLWLLESSDAVTTVCRLLFVMYEYSADWPHQRACEKSSTARPPSAGRARAHRHAHSRTCSLSLLSSRSSARLVCLCLCLAGLGLWSVSSSLVARRSLVSSCRLYRPIENAWSSLRARALLWLMDLCVLGGLALAWTASCVLGA